jgi:DNA-binding beta-propeller fold protein YncE
MKRSVIYSIFILAIAISFVSPTFSGNKSNGWDKPGWRNGWCNPKNPHYDPEICEDEEQGSPDYEREWYVNRPFGITVCKLTGNVIVVNQEARAIVVYNPEGIELDRFGTRGIADGQIYRPCAVTTDSHGNIYVVDQGQPLQKYGPDGTFKWSARFLIGDGGPTSELPLNSDDYPLLDYPLRGPYGVVTDEDDIIYVADRGGDRYNIVGRITKFDTDGNFLGRFPDVLPDEILWDITYNKSTQTFFILTQFNIYEMSKDGIVLNTWQGDYWAPFGIAVDPDGNIVISDRYNNEIDIYTINGIHLYSWGSLGDGPNQYTNPYRLTITENGEYYIADYNNYRVQKLIK